MIDHPAPRGAHDITGSTHRLGDGRHPLPVHCLGADGLRRLESDGCIRLLLVVWAHRAGHDAVAIDARANPDHPRLRPDLLLLYRPWVHVPDPIDPRLLRRDLLAIGERSIVAVLDEIDAGRWRPPARYTHWLVTDDGRLAGEARDLDPPDAPDRHGQHFCHVRLFAMPEMAEWGYADAMNLRPKARM
ncbi:MAG: hypothetical protein ACYTG1_03605 [Planctomycetota bacterium]|jgi:hypothetical protein